MSSTTRSLMTAAGLLAAITLGVLVYQHGPYSLGKVHIMAGNQEVKLDRWIVSSKDR